MTIHASLHTCLSEISENDYTNGSSVAAYASTIFVVDRGRSPFYEGAIISTSGKVTDGPEYGLRMVKQLISFSHQ